MPKIKTNRGAAKRLRKTKKGSFKRHRSFSGHLRVKKSPKRKRALRRAKYVSASDKKQVKRLLPHA